MRTRAGAGRGWIGRAAGVLAVVVALFALPTLASAHLERPSYWPNPKKERLPGGTTAGGEVPDARSLASAVSGAGPGEVRVVCQGAGGSKSLGKLERAVDAAVSDGYRLRPSQPVIAPTAAEGRRLMRMNRSFARDCDYHAIQDAVNDSGNNDRIVIMPGRYTEPKSRRAEVNDPRCNPDLLQEDQSGALTPSYEYQAKCPNDQNLIYVQGRAVKGDPLAEPDPDRHGIPDQELGRCIRCNLQIDGSGVRPEDVLIDAGKNYTNPMAPGARPGGTRSTSECRSEGNDNPCFGKHVVMRTDRSDGFVGRNFLLRGAKEHGFYTEETDGIFLDKVKFFWNRDYGHLSFTTDHNLIQNCDGFGSGDAVVYPGAAPQTGEFRDEEFYPEQRFNTTVRRCDLHGSSMGYSGSMGNSVRVTQNRFYANANGLTTDTLSAQGHPGFPADGMKIDHNWFYANNLDVYQSDPPFDPLVPQPVGSGFLWPGHNDGSFIGNHVFDNWRQGTMLFSVPDSIAGEPEGNVDPQIHCPTGRPDPVVGAISTSCDNRYSGNVMGEVPAGFRMHPGLRKFGNKTSLAKGASKAPNGVDFWWDEFTANTGNCWPGNTGVDGTRGSITADPPIAPVAGQSLPGTLPENCSGSVGSLAYGVKGAELLGCYAAYEGDMTDDPATCSWFDTPARPGSPQAAADARAAARERRELSRSAEAAAISDWAGALAGGFDPYGPGE